MAITSKKVVVVNFAIDGETRQKKEEITFHQEKYVAELIRINETLNGRKSQLRPHSLRTAAKM